MQNDTEKISRFINLISPLVCAVAKKFIQSFGWQVSENGSGIDTVFSLKADGKEAEFYLRNLLLEIATIDRDECPLRFDENLQDFDTLLAKTIQLLASKLKILLHLLSEEDAETAINKITEEAKNYQRIRIIRIDQGSQEQSEE